MSIFQDTYRRARANSRKVLIGTLAVVGGAIVIASPWSSGGGGGGGGYTCDATISSGNIEASVASVVDGGRVCLNAGSYSWSGTVRKSAMTTVSPANGVATSAVTISGGVNASSGTSNVDFDHLTIGSSSTSSSTSGASTHIHFTYDTFTGSFSVYTPTNVDQDTLIDHSRFLNIGQSCNEGRIGICGQNVTHDVVNGVVISSNDIGNSVGSAGDAGASDGIQLNGGAYGTLISGNTIHDIKESQCGSTHCDPLQFYGGRNTTITGNYFYGNSTGIMSGDGNGSPMTVTNNVFYTDGEYPDQIVIGGGSGDAIAHNTFANGAGVRFGRVNAGASSNETLTNNVITGTLNLTEGQTTTGFTINYNLSANATARGANGVNGSPLYPGGSSPSTWAGYALASSSQGYHAASDGLSMGIH